METIAKRAAVNGKSQHLSQTTVARLVEPPQPLDDAEDMLDARPHARLDAVDHAFYTSGPPRELAAFLDFIGEPSAQVHALPASGG